ncbi:hypothetical protein [Nocardia sp. NBC_01329]|uniref:hypothetical protein n=1 Tax=Nocardia sp. NBC_01329 TaxID=2903594 RepID=UPI002E152A42|nr:hypothetical protein OG405_17710 [Nocardia sp. NBC_01329]
MSVSTRTETGRPARRVHDAERVKSGAAQRAYARRRQRAGGPGAVQVAAPRTELAGRGPFVAAILAMFGCGLALTLVLTTRAAEDSYQLSDARETNRVLSDERAALQREVAAADSAPELATRARELGMIPAQDPARLVVAPDGTVTVVGEPKPAQGPPAPPLNAPPRGGGPRNGADPGERIVPVPALPRSDSAAPSSGEVLAAPGSDPTPAPQQAENVPVPSVPAPDPATNPEGAPPGGDIPPPDPAEGAAPAGAPAPIEGVAVAPAPVDAPEDAPGSVEPTSVAPLPPVTAGEEMR